MKKVLSLVYIFLELFTTSQCIDATIPSRISECYRRNMTQIHDKLHLPMTMQLLIELVQKVETNHGIDMRVLTSSMLYNAKFDGIQRVSNSLETENIVPVGPTSIHFNKFRLILNYLTSGDESAFPSDALTKTEFCALHRMISSSVQAWERGDESRTCPQIRMMPKDLYPKRLIIGNQKSTCPIEKGISKTNWGDVSAGHLLMAVATALQNQNVKLMQILNEVENNEHIEVLQNTTDVRHLEEEEVNNLWASTLAGDLGEVIAYQWVFVRKLVIGQGGVWNDTLVPRAYYLPDSIGSYWEMTLGDTLGGMDGAIIGNSIFDWTNKIGRLRFSQVLDMYYSKRGIEFEETFRACERKKNIKKILEDVDLVQQTAGMAKLLQYYFLTNPLQEWVPLPEEEIVEVSKEVVDEFLLSLDALTDLHSACEKGYDIPVSNIFVVIDGTWNPYEGLRLISALAHAVDVSHYGSRMGIISGQQGTWMTNFTSSIFQIFEDLSKDDLIWPSTLALSDSFGTIISFLSNKTTEECSDRYKSTRNTIILVISPTAKLYSIDLEKSKSLVRSLKAINPTFSVLYITTDETTESFEPLVKNEFANDKIIKTSGTVDAIVDRIASSLEDAPGQIIDLVCTNKSAIYEDYITPSITKQYEISYRTLLDIKEEIKIEFTGQEYGNMSICANDKVYPEHKVCRWIDDRNSSACFDVRSLCQDESPCNVQFKVSLVHSKNKCTDDECRFFSQVRLNIRTTWNASNVLNAYFLSIILSIFITLFY